MVTGYRAIFLVLASAALVRAEAFSYECDAFPGDSDWIVINEFCDFEQWIDQGTLFQHVELCDGFPQPGGQQTDYTRDLNEFIGVDTFFLEWRVLADGDNSEMIWVAPSSVVIGGFTGVKYHFTVARDLARLIRDNALPIIFVELDPDVPHTHRLELYGADLYVWYIDGVVVDSGVPEGAYPTHVSNNIKWRSKSGFLENLIAWDYIRYGEIPQDHSGDWDSSGVVDIDDFYFFAECVAERGNGPNVPIDPGCEWADMDQDNDVDFHDFAVLQRRFVTPE